MTPLILTEDVATARTIDDVLARLDTIIEQARRENDRAGFFAVLYHGVTTRVKADIQAGRFDDGPRMEQFDVTFANRYLDALQQYRQGDAPSACWQIAFKACAEERPAILQHLLLGMNAHINLDLGIAAAHTCPGAELDDLRRDFLRINNILLGMLDDVQQRLSSVSPWIGLLDWAGGCTDECVARFSLKGSRLGAWTAARRLAYLDPSQQAHVIQHLDHKTTSLGRLILTPGVFVLPRVMRVVRLAERRSAAEVIDALTSS